MAGVAIAQEVIERFNEFKLRSASRYILYKLSDSLTEVVIDKIADPSATYQDFLNDLPPNDCRYAVFNFEYDAGSDGKRAKVIFFNWAPETAKIKSKMVYAATKDSMKKALIGISVEIQGTDASEVDPKEVLEKCKSVSR
eukprot:TRINITY_DN1832_c0_g1_i2.p1 TRINITY_DN1832_c0_g1~~TRINITY_DN1832_c0_g1_i2.p1  ORF type:complete len:162 (+),score=48.75 TRINITY_DN1832_c0_g1_i2:69-488(+)